MFIRLIYKTISLFQKPEDWIVYKWRKVRRVAIVKNVGHNQNITVYLEKYKSGTPKKTAMQGFYRMQEIEWSKPKYMLYLEATDPTGWVSPLRHFIYEPKMVRK